tara:strand:+ start:40 stop:471 length:432 start_codon:yes stop_codon:yes gene_type:complete
MYLDAQNLFDDNAAHLTTEASTNLIDLGAARNIGVGEDIYFVIQVDTAFTDGSSNSTMTITLETDDNASFSSATTAQTVGTFAALAAAGTRLVAKLQPEQINERFLRVKYTVASGDLSTGKFTAFLTKDLQAYTSYPDGITIS